MSQLLDSVTTSGLDDVVRSLSDVKIGTESQVDDDDEDDEECVDDENDAGGNGGGGDETSKKKKKKKKTSKKKKKATAKPPGSLLPKSRMLGGFTDYYLKYGQTVVPSVPVADLFPHGDFPLGEVQPHGITKHPVERFEALRVSEEEKRFEVLKKN